MPCTIYSWRAGRPVPRYPRTPQQYDAHWRRMTYEATHQTAIDLIAVHGRHSIWVAGECVRVLLRCADKEAVASWLEILEAVRARLRY
jgi:hypothetical protein